jgi:asparagine synthase (glutamine-hydrolysing)
MCGIAGLVDLSATRRAPPEMLDRMGCALFHRGPDDEGRFDGDGVGLINRRLSIIGLADGRQPMTNEDGSVVAVFNGELFDYPEAKRLLESRGHRFKTHCDAELIPHFWEEYREGMFERLRGQFALALCDRRQRCVVLARDRFGILPLYWSRPGRTFEGSIRSFTSSQCPDRPRASKESRRCSRGTIFASRSAQPRIGRLGSGPSGQ